MQNGNSTSRMKVWWTVEAWMEVCAALQRSANSVQLEIRQEKLRFCDFYVSNLHILKLAVENEQVFTLLVDMIHWVFYKLRLK